MFTCFARKSDFRLHAQLSETSCKLARLHSDTERTPQDRHDRKSPAYHPDKQLEELRSLQVYNDRAPAVFCCEVLVLHMSLVNGELERSEFTHR